MLKAALQHSLLQPHLPTPPQLDAGTAGDGGGSGLADEGGLGTGAVLRSVAPLLLTLWSVLYVITWGNRKAQRVWAVL